MTGSEILRTSLQDLIFENRNKLYGAYALRKQYNQRLLTALGVSISFVLAVLFIITKNKNEASDTFINNDPIEDLIVHTQMIPELPKLPEQPKSAKPLQPAAPVAKQYTSIRIVTDPVQISDVPMQTDLINIAISNTTLSGKPAEALPALPESNTYKPEPNIIQSALPANADPHFPGGAAAWSAFLSRHLQASEMPEAGEKITVLVRFLVSENRNGNRL